MSVRLETTCVQSSQSVTILPAVMSVCACQDTLEMENTVLVRHNITIIRETRERPLEHSSECASCSNSISIYMEMLVHGN